MWQNSFSARPFTFGGSLERRQSCLSLQTIREACNREFRLADADFQSAPHGATPAREDDGTLDKASRVASNPRSRCLLAGEGDLPSGLLSLHTDPAPCTRLPWTSEVQPTRVSGNVSDATRGKDLRLFPCCVSSRVPAPYTTPQPIQRFPGNASGKSRHDANTGGRRNPSKQPLRNKGA
ncbi:conserved hypothetical protein [Neospora caninum Liverpool]|uniref:Uncharacterized protein n=1 Tax=Neospora caninum (strain Liverpool) TaxID=572307 RepID=F0VBF8_NEOCL|nr:conserved hypothetical protein [Neospora caninum Liverpool]CBZ50942.1 conserved hypothetical protein [Neospora caninum Liverpool]CEL68243.1 TPA: hypothetical protein BN1204_040170 [Neospora caninum Liverpool]|eukprot:XP_003880975.1 conserved hypothetical protein [Neospora caninum Liverpool]